jgi:hypothetical protein
MTFKAGLHPGWRLLGVALLIGLAGCNQSRGRGANARGPYCAVVSQFVSTADCAALQAQSNAESNGTAAFNAPNPMKRGDKATVWLAVADLPPPAVIPPVAPREPEIHQHLVRHAAEPGQAASSAAALAGSPAASAAASAAGGDSSNVESPPPQAETPTQLVSAMPGRTTTYSVTVGAHMAAYLVGDNGFDVKAISPARQTLHQGAPYPATLWRWDITALHGGAHTLTIRTVVEGIDSSGNHYELISTPAAYSFTVVVTPLEQVEDAIETAPKWIKAITAVVAALTALVTAVVGFRAAMKKWGGR